jgi:hypothetical protein
MSILDIDLILQGLLNSIFFQYLRAFSAKANK